MGAWEDAERLYNKYKHDVSKIDIPSSYRKHSDLLDSMGYALSYYNAHNRYTDKIGCIIEKRAYGRDRMVFFDIEDFDIYNGQMSYIKIHLKGNVAEINEYEKESNMSNNTFNYCFSDVMATNGMMRMMLEDKKFHYKEVIFNPPATIIKWQDGTKTVVKCSPEDEFDPEKGIALCYMKKALGNRYGYYNTMQNLLKKFHDDRSPVEKLWRNLKKGAKNQNGKSDS